MRSELKAHASTEEFKFELQPTGGGGKGKSVGKPVPLTLCLTGTAFAALDGCTPGIATIHYTFGGKKGTFSMPVYDARALFIACRRCCANVVSIQYGRHRSQARPPAPKSK